jgi:hypothetical protein
MTTNDGNPKLFPLPSLDYLFPSQRGLQRWAGYDDAHVLTPVEHKRLKSRWADEMHAAGWVIAWIEPATMRIANQP